MAIKYRLFTGESVKRILGVSFGKKSLKASVVDFGFRTVKHIESLSVSLPDGEEEKGNSVVDLLKKWKQHYNPKGMVIGLPLDFFSYQFIDMPSMNRIDMKNALHFELEKYLPLPVEEYIYDFISPPAHGDGMKTLVLSVKRNIVDSLLEYAGEADIRILSIGANAMAAVSQLLRIENAKNINGILINCTTDYNEMIGLADSMPVFNKHLSKDADVAGEIERFFSNRSGLVYVNGTLDTSLIERFNSRAVRISIAEALALSGASKSRLSVNFLPPEHVRKGHDFYTYILGGLAIGAVALFLLTGLVRYAKNASLLSSIKAEIAAVQNEASVVLEGHRKLNSIKKERQVLLDFQSKSNLPIRIVSDLSKILSDDVWLIKMQIDEEGKIEMEGFAKKSSSLLVALEESTAFKNVSFSSPIIKRSNEERFSIKMEVETLDKK